MKTGESTSKRKSSRSRVRSRSTPKSYQQGETALFRLTRSSIFGVKCIAVGKTLAQHIVHADLNWGSR